MSLVSNTPTQQFDPKEERRRHYRHELLISANLDTAPDCSAVIANVSKSGLSAMVVPPLDVTRLQLRFTLPGTETTVRITGDVRWTDSTGRYGMSIAAVDCKAGEWRRWFDKLQGPPSAWEAYNVETDQGQSPAETAPEESAASKVGRKLSSRVLRWLAIGAFILALAGVAVKTRPLIRQSLSDGGSRIQSTAQQSSPGSGKSSRGGVTIAEGVPVPVNRLRPRGQIVSGRLLHRTDPVFPEAALAPGFHDVKAILTITEKGSVEQIEVVKGDERLAQEVRSAVGHWRYLPFTRDGVPVAVKLPVTVTFSVQH